MHPRSHCRRRRPALTRARDPFPANDAELEGLLLRFPDTSFVGKFLRAHDLTQLKLLSKRCASIQSAAACERARAALRGPCLCSRTAAAWSCRSRSVPTTEESRTKALARFPERSATARFLRAHSVDDLRMYAGVYRTLSGAVAGACTCMRARVRVAGLRCVVSVKARARSMDQV